MLPLPLPLLLLLLLAMSALLATPAAASCANCGRQPTTRHQRSQLDNLRLDIIQRDILNKLGLQERPPNITDSVPREVLIRTLVRARADTNIASRSEAEPADQFEDGKARTSEIIAMARPGES